MVPDLVGGQPQASWVAVPRIPRFWGGEGQEGVMRGGLDLRSEAVGSELSSGGLNAGTCRLPAVNASQKP